MKSREIWTLNISFWNIKRYHLSHKRGSWFHRPVLLIFSLSTCNMVRKHSWIVPCLLLIKTREFQPYQEIYRVSVGKWVLDQYKIPIFCLILSIERTLSFCLSSHEIENSKTHEIHTIYLRAQTNSKWHVALYARQGSTTT